MYKRFIFLLFILSFPLILAAQPPVVLNSGDGGINVYYQPYETIKANENFKYHLHVINSSERQTNLTTSCIFHFYGLDGSHTAVNGMTWDSSKLEFEYIINSSNLTLGTHAYIITCNNTNKQIAEVSAAYIVTNSGENLAGDIFTTFIWIIFILATGILFYTIFINVAKLVTLNVTVYDVLLSWGGVVLILISSHLGTYYLLNPYIANLSNVFIIAGIWTNGFIPLLGLVITFFFKSTQKKRLLTPEELGGFKYV